MNTRGRLVQISPGPGTHWTCIFPIPSWPGDPGFVSWVNNPPKKWPDFLILAREYPGPVYPVLILSGRVVADLLEAGLADGDFVPLLIDKAPISYFAFRPRCSVRMRQVDVSKRRGFDEPAFASAPDYNDYQGNAFVEGKAADRAASGSCLCIPEVIALAKVKKWTGVSFGSFDDVGMPLYECDARGKISEHTSSRSDVVGGYYVSEEVIASDLVRARQLAAELRNSPNTPEWTRRSFELVSEALIEAPHTLGVPVSKPAKSRVARPDAPLLDAKAIKRLKLEGKRELVGEVALGRPLFGADILSVIVSDEAVDDDAPEVEFTKAEMKRRAQAVLEKLESRLPAIEAAINQLAASYEKPPADFRTELHEPGILLCTAHMAEGERWTFVVEGEVGHHFEFDGDTLVDMWSGD